MYLDNLIDILEERERERDLAMIVVRDMLLFSWMFSLLKFQISTSFFLYGFRILGTLRVLSELMTGFLLGIHVLTLWESDGHCS